MIHYQLPASADVYVHRSGRTARGQAEGISIALVGPKEQTRFQALWQALERDAPPEFPVDTLLMPAVSCPLSLLPAWKNARSDTAAVGRPVCNWLWCCCSEALACMPSMLSITDCPTAFSL